MLIRYWGFSTDNFGNQYIAGGTTSFNNFPVFNGFRQTFSSPQQMFLSRFNQNHKLIWCTFFGGSGDDQSAFDIKCKSNGDVYFVGYTKCNNCYTGSNHSGATVDNSQNGADDGYIGSFDSTGVFPKWGTYLGSTGSDRAYSLSFDQNDNLYVSGYCANGLFPIQTPTGAYQGSYGGSNDAFIAEFNSSDSLIWSSFIGGSGLDWSSCVRCDKNNNAYIFGGTYSSNFPCSNPGLGGFIDSTLNGTTDNFFIKFNSNHQSQWSTYIGGSGDEFTIPIGAPARSGAIGFDSFNNIYLAGSTSSSNFPLHQSSGFFDSTNTDFGGYIMKFSSSTLFPLWSTYFSGGHGDVHFNALTVNKDDYVFICGSTSDTSFHLHSQPSIYFQDTLRGTGSPYAVDGCLVAFDSKNNLIYGTYFGGYNTNTYGEFISDITVNDDKLFFTGYTTANYTSRLLPLSDPGNNAYFDTVYNGGNQDAFVSEICISSVINVPEIEQDSSNLTVYPNPSNAFYYIKYTNSKSTFDSKIEIYNIMGQIIQSKEVKILHGSNVIFIDMSDQGEGAYIVQIAGLNQAKRILKLDK